MEDQEMKRPAQYDKEGTVGWYTNSSVPMEPTRKSKLESQNEILGNVLPRFDYHAPNASQIPKYQNLRDAAKAFATVIVRNCPMYAQETQSAIQGVEAVLMLANKSIALNDR